MCIGGRVIYGNTVQSVQIQRYIPCDEEERGRLAPDVISGHRAQVGGLVRLDLEVLRRGLVGP